METTTLRITALGACLLWGARTPSHGQGGVFAPASPPPPPAFAGGKEGELVIYGGELAASPFGLTLGAWGGGAGEEVKDPHYKKGPKSLKVTVKDLYQGARIDFKQGPTLPPTTEAAYLILELAIGEQTQQTPMATGGVGMTAPGVPLGFEGAGAAAPGAGAGAAPVAGGPAGPQAGGAMPGAPGTSGSGDTGAVKKEKELEHLRILAVYDKGVVVAERYPLIIHSTDPEGWSKVAVPFTAFKGKTAVEGRLRRLAICGDDDETFNIGRISVMQDKSAMSAKILRVSTNEEADTEINAGEDVDLKVDYEVGLAAVDVGWDFDASDGIQEDEVGESVTHNYPKPGTFTVTAVVKDLANQKSAVVATYTVNVKK